MQAVGGLGHGRAQLGNRFYGQGLWLIQPVLQCLARHVLHDDVGHAQQVACGHKLRHMGAVQRRQDVQLYLKADDVLRPVTGCHARDFHHHRKAR